VRVSPNITAPIKHEMETMHESFAHRVETQGGTVTFHSEGTKDDDDDILRSRFVEDHVALGRMLVESQAGLIPGHEDTAFEVILCVHFLPDVLRRWAPR